MSVQANRPLFCADEKRFGLYILNSFKFIINHFGFEFHTDLNFLLMDDYGCPNPSAKSESTVPIPPFLYLILNRYLLHSRGRTGFKPQNCYKSPCRFPPCGARRLTGKDLPCREGQRLYFRRWGTEEPAFQLQNHKNLRILHEQIFCFHSVNRVFIMQNSYKKSG